MWLSVSGGEECRRLGGGVGQVLGGPLVRLCGPASADTQCSQSGLGRMDAAGKGSKPAETEPHGKQDMEDFLHSKVLFSSLASEQKFREKFLPPMTVYCSV